MNPVEKMHEQSFKRKKLLHTLSGAVIPTASALMYCSRMRRRERRLNNSL